MKLTERILKKFHTIRQLPKEQRAHGDYRWMPTAQRIKRSAEILRELTQMIGQATQPIPSNDLEEKALREELFKKMMYRQTELSHHHLDTWEWIREGNYSEEEAARNEEAVVRHLEEILERLELAKKSILTRPETN